MSKTTALGAVIVVVALLCPQVFGQQKEGTEKPTTDAVEVEPFHLSAWMTGFHKTPDPDRVAWVIREMSHTGSFTKNGPTNTAFLAEVFRLYPDRVASWAGERDGLPEADRHWLYLAVWWSDVPGAVKLLEAAAEKESPELKKGLHKYIENYPSALLEMALTKPERLDMLWASYFASGKSAYVERIATALELAHAEEKTLESAVIYRAARWSLTSNAQQHEAIRKILENLLAQSSSHVREELDAILEKVRAQDASKVDPDTKNDKDTQQIKK